MFEEKQIYWWKMALNFAWPTKWEPELVDSIKIQIQKIIDDQNLKIDELVDKFVFHFSHTKKN
jgi:hypothetical protein